jgi:N-formylglutamate deformylase
LLVVETVRGTSPVVLGFPHTGTEIPAEVYERLNENGRVLADTDWHVHTLYSGLLPGASTVRATYHRYVIDANRDPEGSSLYPGQNTTGLVPMTDFDGKPIWIYGHEPTAGDVAHRLEKYHAPYHRALADEIERVKAQFGIAVLYDCHSIRSHIPFLFPGNLPDFNIGTDSGRSCSAEFEAAVSELAHRAESYNCVLNGRFKGGWTTDTTGVLRTESTLFRWSFRKSAI